MTQWSRWCWAAAGWLVTQAAWPAASVTYVNPERFADAGRSPWERERILKDLGAHLEKLGRALPPEQHVKIEITDLDLAGRLEPNRGSADDIRLLRGGADWPRLRLRYVLEAQGRVIDSGEQDLSNMNYLNRINRYNSGDSLRYEKHMLDDWFQAAFLKDRPG
ncbi:MAG: DUF3016 domain-containing protein [Pseudomonadota bacterium]